MTSVPDNEQGKLKDLYGYHKTDVTESPRGLFRILRRIGPGMILAASIVGSGELIATTTPGAEVGYVALWVIIISCLIKPAVQSEIGRYVISTGETGLEAFDHVPGPRFKVNWVVWAWARRVLRASQRAMSSSILATMRCCSASGGSGTRNDIKPFPVTC